MPIGSLINITQHARTQYHDTMTAFTVSKTELVNITFSRAVSELRYPNVNSDTLIVKTCISETSLNYEFRWTWYRKKLNSWITLTNRQQIIIHVWKWEPDQMSTVTVELAESAWQLLRQVTRNHWGSPSTREQILRGHSTHGPYFWRLCAFFQKIRQLWTKFPIDLVRNVPRNSENHSFTSTETIFVKLQ